MSEARGGDRPDAATVVLSQRVCAGREDDYERWQSDINAAAQKFAGFEGAEMMRPVVGIQDDYVIVYRFDTSEHLAAWLDSEVRADWMARGQPLFAEQAVQQHIRTPRSQTVTVVVSHRVKPGADEEYRDWQQGIDRVVRQFPGFVSTEIFEPGPEQPDWVVVFRFEDDRHLQGWLGSAERAEWLAQAAPLLESWQIQKVSGGLGGWFAIATDGGDARVAPAWKQGMAVLLGLYPTVMILLMVLTPHLTDLARPVQMLVANFVSVALLTWLVMPGVTRGLRSWLDPRASQAMTLVGAAGLVATYAGMTGLFWAVW